MRRGDEQACQELISILVHGRNTYTAGLLTKFGNTT